MEKINFSNKTWQEKLNMAYSFRYTDSPVPCQLADCIQSGVNKDHPEGFDSMSFLFSEKYSVPVSVRLECEFEGCGCAEIIIVPEAEKCPDGVLRYGACYEVVLFKDGLNVWRHFYENGKCFWHKTLGVDFPVAEKERHTLEVIVKENYIDVSVDAMSFSLRLGDLPEKFHTGFTTCEGVVRLYSAELETADIGRGKENELEKMAEFFDRRLEGYDEHMLNDIEYAKEFYPYTAGLLPMSGGAAILDLGCGTGIELEEYLKLNPTAKVTGIDLAPGMLGELKRKLSQYDVTTVLGSYFDVPLGEGMYDAAVSVESLHHFTRKAKTELYKKLHASLKDGGYFILTDYLIDSDEQEELYMSEYNRLRGLQGKHDGELYHFDTPLTATHECEALRDAGFSSVEILCSFGNTKTIKAIK